MSFTKMHLQKLKKKDTKGHAVFFNKKKVHVQIVLHTRKKIYELWHDNRAFWIGFGFKILFYIRTYVFTTASTI